MRVFIREAWDQAEMHVFVYRVACSWSGPRVYVLVPPGSRAAFLSDELCEQLAAGESEPVTVSATLRGDLYVDLTMSKVAT